MLASKKPTSSTAASPTRSSSKSTPTRVSARKSSSVNAPERGMNMTKHDFVSLADTPQELLQHFLRVARHLKHERKTKGENAPLARGKVLACIFEKPSLRTRVSFETAMAHLSGHALYISPS